MSDPIFDGIFCGILGPFLERIPRNLGYVLAFIAYVLAFEACAVFTLAREGGIAGALRFMGSWSLTTEGIVVHLCVGIFVSGLVWLLGKLRNIK